MRAFQRGAVGRVVCHFCLKIAQKPLKHLPGLRPGPAESTHLWTRSVGHGGGRPYGTFLRCEA
eukprot:scaffold21985_cov21-Phaeocystis_antarctica.AAC.1